MIETEDRKAWMGVLARARPTDLAARFPSDAPPDGAVWIRAPETGTTMVRGRTGGQGAPFNLGEMTVTRASLRLSCGTVGHAYVQGRDKSHARRAAILDALLQTAAQPDLQSDVVRPLVALEAERRRTRAAKAAATKVDFFTLARGEDT